ncbi:hypothetical protein DPMN_132444 [Dreissena polymorpha]|uniref:B box-type domain-containing protein n=1 Tax=Dreissena polymorpha TaxID=45954 RepID=A0A9D4FTD5_DREPO|nr:hypothetical protein DPMN_132444 [Dreissena polymorpha]
MGNATGIQKKTDSKRENAGDFIGQLSVTQSCDPCMKSNITKTASYFCENCDEFLCETCKNPHCVYKPGKHDIVGSQDIVDINNGQVSGEEMYPRNHETTKDSKTTSNTLKLEPLIAIQLLEVAGMDFMPDGRLVTVYKNKQCIIMNDKLIKIGKRYLLRNIPLGVVCMSDSQIAVTLDNQTVCVFDVEKDCVMRETRMFRTSVTYNSLRKLDNSTLVGFTRDTSNHARKITIYGMEEDFESLKKRDYTSMCTPNDCKCVYMPSRHTFLTFNNSKLFLHDTETSTSTDVQVDDKIYALCQGSADSVLVICKSGVVQITMKGEILQKCSSIGYVQMVCVNNNFSMLAFITGSFCIKLYSSTTRTTWSLEPRATLEFFVTGMDFLPDGRLVAVYATKTCEIMNDKLNKIGKKFLFTARPLDVVCMSDSEIAVALDNMTVCIISVRNDNVMQHKRSFNTQVQYYALRKLDFTTMVGFAAERAGKISIGGIEQDFNSFVKTGYVRKSPIWGCNYAYIHCINMLATAERMSKKVYLQDPKRGTSKCVQLEKKILALCPGPVGTVFVVCEGEFLQISCEGRTLNKCSFNVTGNRVCANKDFSVIALSTLSSVNLYKLSI